MLTWCRDRARLLVRHFSGPSLSIEAFIAFDTTCTLCCGACGARLHCLHLCMPCCRYQTQGAAQRLNRLPSISTSPGGNRHAAGAMLLLPAATGSPGHKACGRSYLKWKRMVQHGSGVLMQRQLRLRSSAAEAPEGHVREPACANGAPIGAAPAPGGAKTGSAGAQGPSGRPAGGAAPADGRGNAGAGRGDRSGGSADSSPAVSAPEWPPVRRGTAAVDGGSAAADGGEAELGAMAFYGSGGARRHSQPAGHAAPSQPVHANGHAVEGPAGFACNGPVAQAEPSGSRLGVGRGPGAEEVRGAGRTGLGGGGGSGEPGAGSGVRTSDPAAVRAFLQASHSLSLVCICRVF